jgi:epoxyqueuosine reductase
MDLSGKATLTEVIKSKASVLGFDLCGIAEARPLTEHISRIRSWCGEGLNSDMGYLCRDVEKRTDPDKLFPGCKSVIVTGLSYYSEQLQGGSDIPVISRYAYGINYHDVILAKLNELLAFIRSNSPATDGKAFVDSAPLLEKAWAREAGLGWPGKHSVLINEKIGSFFFLGILLLNTSLTYDIPFTADKCGKCRLCIEACPVAAINGNHTIDTRKCIAYVTIESKAPIPADQAEHYGNRVFGCDRCQEVCPWNRDVNVSAAPEFKLNPEIRSLSAGEWKTLSSEKFKTLFSQSPIGRKKYGLFMQNIEILGRSRG